MTILSTAVGNNEGIRFHDFDCVYNWCYLKRLPLQCITLDYDLCSSPSPAVIWLLSNNRLIELSAPVCGELISVLLSLDIRVHRFREFLFVDEPIPLELLQLLGPNVRSLELNQSVQFCDYIGHDIARLCPNLTSCNIPNFNMRPVLANCPIKSMSHVALTWINSQFIDSLVYVDLESTNDRGDSVLLIGSMGYLLTKAYYITEDEEIQFLAPYLNNVQVLSMDCEWLALKRALSHCSHQLSSLIIVCDFLDEATLSTMFESFPTLKELELHGEAVNNSVVSLVAMTCPALEKFRLVDTTIHDMMLHRVVQNCVHLTKLSVSQPMDEQILLSTAFNVQTLTIRYKSDHSSSFAKPEPNHLVFISSDAVTSSGFQSLFEQNLSLMKVEFFQQTNFGNDAIKILVQSCSMLTDIKIVRCKGVTTQGLYTLTECNHLKKLEYETYHMENKISLKRLLTGLTALECLHLRACSDLEGEELQWVAKCCPEISDVALTYCVRLLDSNIMSLIKECPKLVALDISECSWLTAALIPTLSECRLKHLRLSGTNIGAGVAKGFGGRVDDYGSEEDDVGMVATEEEFSEYGTE